MSSEFGSISVSEITFICSNDPKSILEPDKFPRVRGMFGESDLRRINLDAKDTGDVDDRRIDFGLRPEFEAMLCTNSFIGSGKYNQ
jgi:hypothetical protein